MQGWLIDIGNTRLKLAALAAPGAPGEVLAIASDDADAMQRLVASIAVMPAPVWLASVAPPPTTARVQQALDEARLPWRRVRTQAACAGVRIAYADPEALGVDRFLALLAAHARRPRRAHGSLVVGVGTALTVDLLAADGQHLGGRIAPGRALQREALHARVPHLPGSGGEARDFADNTDDALASGVRGMLRGAIADAQAAARQRLGRRPHLVVHGGDAEAVASDFPDAEVRADLVLEGLAGYVAAEGG
jgi:type III pantothenate kinase